MITDQELKEFKGLYKKEFGKDISDEEALESATSLINLMRVIYKPIKKSDFEEFCRKNNETSEGAM